MFKLTTPVAFFIFNRPKVTRRVFAEIRKAAPSRLLIVADGPREGHLADSSLCSEAREIVKEVDWDCEVETDFAERNLGVGKRVSSGIDWVFSRVEEAIILEDDCLPDPSFFRFCQELLEKYRRQENILMISGTNELIAWKEDTQSYHFHYCGSIWGWATWRRAWACYDFELQNWPSEKERTRLLEVLGDPAHAAFRARCVQRVHSGVVDTWDYQWSHARVVNAGLSVTPARNLISNIGFGPGATHTVQKQNVGGNHCRRSLEFPLQPPSMVGPDRLYDRDQFQWRTNRPSFQKAVDRLNILLDWDENMRALQLVDALRAGFLGETLDREALSQVHIFRAKILRRLGKPKFAEKELAQAQALDPNNDKAGELGFS